MKVALILPKGVVSTNEEFRAIWKDAGYPAPDRYMFSGFALGLLVFAALLPESYDIEFIDEDFQQIDFEQPYDFVAISATTQKVPRAYEIGDLFRHRGVTVLMGGIHPTVMPEEAKEHSDSVVVGEVEGIISDLLRDIESGVLKPFYRNGDVVDIRKSPIPRYDLVDPGNYKVIWVQTARGCPHDCEFCAATKVYGSRYRRKRLNRVLQEIGVVKDIWKYPILGFADDNMFVNRKYSSELVRSLVPMNVRFIAQSDISVGEDAELLAALRQAGCIALYIGFESISVKSLEGLDKHNWKKRKLKEYASMIKNIQSNGIGVIGSFILGLDGDPQSVFEDTAQFIIDNNLYGSAINILTPLPGTRLRDRLEREGRLLEIPWDRYSYWNVNYKPRQFSPDQLIEGLLYVYRKVYSPSVRRSVSDHFKAIYRRRLDNSFSSPGKVPAITLPF